MVGKGNLATADDMTREGVDTPELADKNAQRSPVDGLSSNIPPITVEPAEQMMTSSMSSRDAEQPTVLPPPSEEAVTSLPANQNAEQLTASAQLSTEVEQPAVSVRPGASETVELPSSADQNGEDDFGEFEGAPIAQIFPPSGATGNKQSSHLAVEPNTGAEGVEGGGRGREGEGRGGKDEKEEGRERTVSPVPDSGLTERREKDKMRGKEHKEKEEEGEGEGRDVSEGDPEALMRPQAESHLSEVSGCIVLW